MTNDADLLQRFAENGDEQAFRTLVDRHIALVYSSAVRQLNGDVHLAADVTQQVFVDLARKARSLRMYPVLAGWLFTSTRFAAAKIVRGEQRRRVRETEAQLMEEILHDSAPALEWSRVRPVLDQAMAELPPTDREAILLRYFERHDYREIGARLNVSDNTARMRVDRALEKLRSTLERRGVTSTSVALGAVLAAEAVAAPPAGLAASVSGAAIASGVSASGFMTFMAMTKFQIGITGALAVAGATGFVSQARTNATLQDEVAALRKETVGIGQLRDENLRLARTVAEADSLRREGETFVRMSAEAEDLDRRFRQVARLNAAKIASSETYDVKKVDQLPKMVRSKPPAYPKVLRDGGVQGEVLVEFIVTAEGAVRDAKVVSSSHPDFEEPSLAAVREWAFDPGIKSGRNVNTRMQVPLKFALQNETGTAGNPEPKANPDARKG